MIEKFEDLLVWQEGMDLATMMEIGGRRWEDGNGKSVVGRMIKIDNT